MIMTNMISDMLEFVALMYVVLFITANVWSLAYKVINKDIQRSKSNLEHKKEYYNYHDELDSTLELSVYQNILDLYKIGSKCITTVGIVGISALTALFLACMYFKMYIYVYRINIVVILTVLICFSMLFSVYINRFHDKVQLKIFNYFKKEN